MRRLAVATEPAKLTRARKRPQLPVVSRMRGAWRPWEIRHRSRRHTRHACDGTARQPGPRAQEYPQRTAAGSPDPGMKAHERARPAPPDVLQRARIAVGRVAPHHATPVRGHPHVDGCERDAGGRLRLDGRFDASPQAAAGDAAGAPLDVSRRAGVVNRDREPSSRALLQHHVFGAVDAVPAAAHVPQWTGARVGRAGCGQREDADADREPHCLLRETAGNELDVRMHLGKDGLDIAGVERLDTRSPTSRFSADMVEEMLFLPACSKASWHSI